MILLRLNIFSNIFEDLINESKIFGDVLSKIKVKILILIYYHSKKRFIFKRKNSKLNDKFIFLILGFLNL